MMDLAKICTKFRALTIQFKGQLRKSVLSMGDRFNLGIRSVKLIRLVCNGHRHKHIKPKSLNQRIHQGGDLIVLDIRARKAFVEGHIENAINIPFSELLKDEEIPLCRDAEIVIVCYFGISSMVVIDILAERGWRNLINMDGGMGAWHYGTIQTNKTA